MISWRLQNETMKRMKLNFRLSRLLITLIASSFFVSGVVKADTFKEASSAYRSGDYSSAYTLSLPLAEQGHVRAQFAIGVMYAHGQGVSQDHGEAATWYRKAAEQGYAMAQSNLGNMYAQGRGVPQDFVKAASWFRKAAEQGEPLAQFNLGVMYESGFGVPEDPVLAYMLFNLAAAQGDQSAMDSRASLVDRLTKVQLEEGQRLSRKWRTGQKLPTKTNVR